MARRAHGERREYHQQWRQQKLAEDPEYFRKRAAANREAMREYHKQWRDANRERLRERQRQWVDEHREEVREYNRQLVASRRKELNEYGKAYYRNRRRGTPEHRARLAVQDAVRRGKLFKPDTCSECKRQLGRRKIHAHHEDYEKRLDVVWLCSTCHGKRHRLT